MEYALDLNSIEDYHLFLKIKALPRYTIQGRVASFPDEYASSLGMKPKRSKSSKFVPSSFLFDYQKDITKIAIQKRKFAIFADCGLGKTNIFLEWIKHVRGVLPKSKSILIISPLMVCRQTVQEAHDFYGVDVPIVQIASKDLPQWCKGRHGEIGITNYESITDKVRQGNIGAIVLDESSYLKSFYGKWGTRIIEIGKGLEWKLCGTGTPAPNDRIEYANHAVFLDQFPNVNSFLSTYFYNKGKTQARWELKPHALNNFYKALSHWSIFLTNPGVYGWKDNCNSLPEIITHIDDINLTDEQIDLAQRKSGNLFGYIGGIASRSTMAGIAKGGKLCESLKPDFIANMVTRFANGGESVIIWCKYNPEQDQLADMLPDAGNIDGSTPITERERIIESFKRGETKILITKPKILGFGLNLQVATRHIFSTLQDSYEEYYQAVKRSNRYGSTRPLNVHIPITDIEYPMVETVLKKASRIKYDTDKQESLFNSVGYYGIA